METLYKQRGVQPKWRLFAGGRRLRQDCALRANQIREGATLHLLRGVCAGAPFDPREERLRVEKEALQQLNAESEHVHVQPINVMPGSEPDHYRVTFKCRGIWRIDHAGNPVFGTLHSCQLKCESDFPSEPPVVTWETDIWHPNIDHKGKSVCVNRGEWVGGLGLTDLCLQLFEMVQYKNYHAEMVPPYPLDGTVAKWVREVGEPRGIVSKSHGVDDRPFFKPTATLFIKTAKSVPSTKSRIRLKSTTTSAKTPTPQRIRVATDKGGSFPNSGTTNGIRIVPRGARRTRSN